MTGFTSSVLTMSKGGILVVGVAGVGIGVACCCWVLLKQKWIVNQTTYFIDRCTKNSDALDQIQEFFKELILMKKKEFVFEFLRQYFNLVGLFVKIIWEKWLHNHTIWPIYTDSS